MVHKSPFFNLRNEKTHDLKRLMTSTQTQNVIIYKVQICKLSQGIDHTTESIGRGWGLKRFDLRIALSHEP